MPIGEAGYSSDSVDLTQFRTKHKAAQDLDAARLCLRRVLTRPRGGTLTGRAGPVPPGEEEGEVAEEEAAGRCLAP